MKSLLRKVKGTAIIETVLTLPVIIYIIFFSLELIKIHLVQVALDNMTKKCTFSLISTGKVSAFDNIINSTRPAFVELKRFKYSIRMYTDLATMMNASPYGGERVAFPNQGDTNSPTSNAMAANLGLGSGTLILHSKWNTTTTSNQIANETAMQYATNGTPGGTAFVLTMVCHYPFSSPLIAKLYKGGSNTNNKDYYILWSRGSGIVNEN